ncbi:MAG: hypothetical protein QF408_08580 [Pirellulales bacterium]|jgi:hypothetical protein|nr:hypothetical protein [Pirellulales bacterium]
MVVNTIKSPVRDDTLDHPLHTSKNKTEHPPVVLLKHHGRLANQLFTFGHLIAHSTETGAYIFNPAFHRYGKYFLGSCRDPLCRFPQKVGRLISYFPMSAHDWLRHQITSLAKRMPNVFSVVKSGREIISLEELTDTYASNHFLAFIGDNYHSSHHNDCAVQAIRNYLQPIEYHQTKINALFEELRADSDLIIGVHIRQGDFRDFAGGTFLRSPQDFANVIEDVIALFTQHHVRFLICSDESVDHELFKQFDYRTGTGHLVEDLYSLAATDYLIGSPGSTFSKWASFYGETPLYCVDDTTHRPSINDFQTALSRDY